MNNVNNKAKENIVPFISAVFCIVLFLCVMYHREIIHWLYVRELWLLPIQLN